MNDLISRQVAIDALDRIFDRCEEIEAHLPEGDPDRTGYKMYPDYMTVWKYLHQLPSAQPEDKCGECDAWNQYKNYPRQQWIPCSERLPSEEERKEWINKNLNGIGYLYPCLVTRYSKINPDRTKNNPYVAKHYFDGEDFVNNGEEVCTEYIIAWMPLPEPWKGYVDEKI